MRVCEDDVLYVFEKIGIAAFFGKIIDAGTRIDQKIVVYKCRGKTAVERAALVLWRPVSRARAEEEKFQL